MLKIHPGAHWSSLQKRTFVGEHFAFFPANCLEGSELNWLGQLYPEALQTPARVLPLWSLQSVELPGATYPGLDRLAACTAVLTCDKQIYETMSDTVHLLVVDPYHPGRRAIVVVRLDGMDFQSIPLILDAHGCGEAMLSHLPAGNYQASVVTESETSLECSFTVAEYRLVPLVAQFQERKTRGNQLFFSIRLESFGLAVEGVVQVALMCEGKAVHHQNLTSQQGSLQGEVELKGEGPFSLNLQLAAQPDCTASLPIVGSRRQDREKTLLSNLGRTVECSLLPSESSVEVRELHLEEGGQRTSPLRLERVDSQTVRLRSAAAVQGLVVCLSDPTFPGLKAPPAADFHPEQADEAYRQGFRLYRERQFQQSGEIFEATWRRAALQGKSVHPYYAYNAACCHALLGRPELALFWLEHAFRDGFKDFKLVTEDADFQSLREHPRFQWLCRGGLRTFSAGDLEAGAQIELPVEGSLALLAAGCFVESKPWEGRAVLVAPERIAPTLEVAAQAEVGTSLKVRLGGSKGTAYVIVKDARLLSTETASSRLAGAIKRTAEEFQQKTEEPVSLARLREKLEETNWQHWVDSRPPTDPFSRQWREPVQSPAASGHFDPFATPGGDFHSFPGPADPFASAPADPFASFSDPFGAPADPFAAPACDPFSAQAFGAADPFAAPAAMDPFASPTTPTPAAAMPAPAPEASAPEAPSVAPQPQTLFAGRLEMVEGGAELHLDLPERPMTLLVEVVVVADRDWRRLEGRCQVEADPYIDLQVTPYVQAGDAVVGRLRLLSSSGRKLRATLTCDDHPVELSEVGPGSFTFPLQPGFFQCLVEDGEDTWQRSARVQAPGKLLSLQRVPQILQAGQSLSREQAGLLELRLLPNLDQPFKLCLSATIDYEHLCCEQTAGKIVAACALWVFGSADEKGRAESFIKAGVQRMETMWLRGRGFRMYPHSSPVPDTYWGPRATQYLWTLHSLRSVPNLSAEVARGLQMAEDTARGYHQVWPPQTIRNSHDAYWALRLKPRHTDALAFLQAWTGAAVANLVERRTELAYAAAALMLAGQQLPRALELANEVTRDLNAEGRLYSTTDSVAAIALLMTMKQLGLGGGSCELTVDGEVRLCAPGPNEPAIGQVSVEKGVALVEITRLVELDWSAFTSNVGLQIDLRRQGQHAWRCKAGDALELVVRLEGSYVTGDLVWVCLPDCLSRVLGGGQLKLFAVDFAGKTEVRIDLAVTGTTGDGSQSFAVCVRNMYDEDRVGNLGAMSVTAQLP